MVACDIDRNGLGNVRFQVLGKREIAICLYSDLVEFSERMAMPTKKHSKKKIHKHTQTKKQKTKNGNLKE